MNVLDLDAVPPPSAPYHRPNPALAFRCSPLLAAFVRESAAAEGMTPSAWLERLVRRERDGGAWLPADVLDWLTIQSAQCAIPGDTEQTAIVVLRHLADRWPHGARLRD